MASICGIHCETCDWKSVCAGCVQTDGKPFGGECMIASCCKKHGANACEACKDAPCGLKGALIREFNSLSLPDMDPITDLYALRGSLVNIEYALPGGQKVRFWDDNRIYLGNQVPKKGTDRLYGLTGDERFLLVCEYNLSGSDPEIVVFKRRNEGSI